MTVRKMFSNIAEIKKANAEAGKFWFSADTTRFFSAKVHSRVYDDGKGHRLWVDSIQDDVGGQPREYKIAQFDVETHDIDRPETNPDRWSSADAAELYLTRNLI